MDNKEIQTWPDLASGLYDKLTGKNAEITYDFDNFEVGVPQKVGDTESQTKWNINGKLKITTTNKDD